MFKMEIDSHNFRKNLPTDKKYILRKIGLQFQNPQFVNSWKIVFYIFFVKCEPFRVRGPMRPFWNKQK